MRKLRENYSIFCYITLLGFVMGIKEEAKKLDRQKKIKQKEEAAKEERRRNKAMRWIISIFAISVGILGVVLIFQGEAGIGLAMFAVAVAFYSVALSWGRVDELESNQVILNQNIFSLQNGLGRVESKQERILKKLEEIRESEDSTS